MGRIMLNSNCRFDVTNAVCDKLYEWFGDVTYITGSCDSKGIMNIYFDNNKVGTFNELYDGIKNLFFDETDEMRVHKLRNKLKGRLLNGRITKIITIARLVVKYKTILVKKESYEQTEKEV